MDFWGLPDPLGLKISFLLTIRSRHERATYPGWIVKRFFVFAIPLVKELWAREDSAIANLATDIYPTQIAAFGDSR